MVKGGHTQSKVDTVPRNFLSNPPFTCIRTCSYVPGTGTTVLLSLRCPGSCPQHQKVQEQLRLLPRGKACISTGPFVQTPAPDKLFSISRRYLPLARPPALLPSAALALRHLFLHLSHRCFLHQRHRFIRRPPFLLVCQCTMQPHLTISSVEVSKNYATQPAHACAPSQITVMLNLELPNFGLTRVSRTTKSYSTSSWGCTMQPIAHHPRDLEAAV